MTRVEVKPELLIWARERADRDVESLLGKFPKLLEWEAGELNPTLKQLECFASTVHLPVGYLFLPAPPVEKMPLPDFRTMGNGQPDRPTPDLLDTIYQCQQRQDWYRDFLRTAGERPLDFVGSAKVGNEVVQTAARMREVLGFEVEKRYTMPRATEDALRGFIELADIAGILVMVSGVVGSNNMRKLDSREFRGFALSDEYAPLIFINGSDTKAAQVFTLAHELVHLWLGQSALTDAALNTTSSLEIEQWCNQVAAEFLVPLNVFEREYNANSDLEVEIKRLARDFRVSTLVILRRIFDLGVIDQDTFRTAFREELVRLKGFTSGGGGNFYHTLGARTSKRFARAVVVSTVEGRSSFTEAFRLLGFKKMSTFKKLSAGFEVRF
jgi:Zn-dependent peptidase ImmA (M78 family)